MDYPALGLKNILCMPAKTKVVTLVIILFKAHTLHVQDMVTLNLLYKPLQLGSQGHEGFEGPVWVMSHSFFFGKTIVLATS